MDLLIFIASITAMLILMAAAFYGGNLLGGVVARKVINPVLDWAWDGKWWAPVGLGVIYRYRVIARLRHPLKEIIMVNPD